MTGISSKEADGRVGRVLGRYMLYDAIAAGGMATVHYGRLVGPVGFSRTVAIKRLHPHLATDPEFVSMFLDEAHLAARIRHPNVVPTLDVITTGGEIFLVMEYVEGASLSRLHRLLRQRGERVPPEIASAILTNVLHGLHAAHETTNEAGEPLDIVHRDVSPHNVLVGADGVARVLDFGVAKATGRLQTTKDGQIKGKLAYMSPEQLRRRGITRRTDIYGASVVLWESLTGRRLFAGEDEGSVLEQVLLGLVEPPGKFVPELPPELDALCLRGLEREPEKRFATAREMALALESCIPPALPSRLGEWVSAIAGEELTVRARQVAEIESASQREPLEPSSVTVTTTAVDPVRGWSRERAGALAVAVLAVLAGAALVIVIALRASAPGASTARGTPPARSIVATAPAPPVEASSVTLTVTTPTSKPAVRPPAHRDATPARGRGAASRCSPPYTIDSTGRMIFKRECL